MRKGLLLRGTIVFLSDALKHVGNGHRTDEWGDGRYMDPAIEKADATLRLALWQVERELVKCS
jgi:hypothetical protein